MDAPADHDHLVSQQVTNPTLSATPEWLRDYESDLGSAVVTTDASNASSNVTESGVANVGGINAVGETGGGAGDDFDQLIGSVSDALSPASQMLLLGQATSQDSSANHQQSPEAFTSMQPGQDTEDTGEESMFLAFPTPYTSYDQGPSTDSHQESVGYDRDVEANGSDLQSYASEPYPRHSSVDVATTGGDTTSAGGTTMMVTNTNTNTNKTIGVAMAKRPSSVVTKPRAPAGGASGIQRINNDVHIANVLREYSNFDADTCVCMPKKEGAGNPHIQYCGTLRQRVDKKQLLFLQYKASLFSDSNMELFNETPYFDKKGNPRMFQFACGLTVSPDRKEKYWLDYVHDHNDKSGRCAKGANGTYCVNPKHQMITNYETFLQLMVDMLADTQALYRTDMDGMHLRSIINMRSAGVGDKVVAEALCTYLRARA